MKITLELIVGQLSTQAHARQLLARQLEVKEALEREGYLSRPGNKAWM